MGGRVDDDEGVGGRTELDEGAGGRVDDDEGVGGDEDTTGGDGCDGGDGTTPPVFPVLGLTVPVCVGLSPSYAKTGEIKFGGAGSMAGDGLPLRPVTLLPPGRALRTPVARGE